MIATFLFEFFNIYIPKQRPFPQYLHGKPLLLPIMQRNELYHGEIVIFNEA